MKTQSAGLTLEFQIWKKLTISEVVWMLLDWGTDSGNHWLLTAAPPPARPLRPSHISSIDHSNFAFYSILLLSKHGVCIRSVPHSGTGLTLHCMDEQIEAL